MLSPGNRFGEMSAKLDFYRKYGVEEYYMYDPDPDRLELSGFLMSEGKVVEIKSMHGHVSPRLKIKFEMGDDGLRLVYPDGRLFGTFEEVALAGEEQRQRAEAAEARAAQERERAEQERVRAEQERVRAEQLQAELDRLRSGLKP